MTTTHTDDGVAVVPATGFVIRPIAPDVLERLRVRDDAGDPPRVVTDEVDVPLRCCLGTSLPGERIGLVSYAPLRRWAAATGARPGPYDEVGPVFVHLEPCEPHDFPRIRVGARRVLRSYDANGGILGGRLVEWPGRAEAGELLAESLADPRVAVVHVRAMEFGCFQFEVARA